MSYYILRTKPLRRVFRWAYFPYCVYEGEPERYPYVRVVQCTDTLWGARRAIRKDRERQPLPPAVVVERVA